MTPAQRPKRPREAQRMPRKPAAHSVTAVALDSPVQRERLPFPFVHYPNHYGTFFAFSEAIDGAIALCDCAGPAVRNYLLLSGSLPAHRNSNPLVKASLSSMDFPDRVAASCVGATHSDIRLPPFVPKLCHRCNLAVPSLRYCVEMYGGEFAQHFGWYIKQSYYHVGIQPLSLAFLETAPSDLKTDLTEHNARSSEERLLVQGLHPSSHPLRKDVSGDHAGHVTRDEAAVTRLDLVRKNLRAIRLRIHNAIEDATRQAFGFRRFGDGWVSETLLYSIVQRLFPGIEVLRHHRPPWLQGLELDIVLPSLAVAIEYQGQQHFEPIEAWGGEESLAALQERDLRNTRLCRSVGISLVTLDFTEPLSEEYVYAKLAHWVDSRSGI